MFENCLKLPMETSSFFTKPLMQESFPVSFTLDVDNLVKVLVCYLTAVTMHFVSNEDGHISTMTYLLAFDYLQFSCHYLLEGD
jgi:hypothetical protein